MVFGSILVSIVAMTGLLFLNYRALQSHGLSLEQKAAMAVGWVLIFALLAFVLTRLGF